MGYKDRVLRLRSRTGGAAGVGPALPGWTWDTMPAGIHPLLESACRRCAWDERGERSKNPHRRQGRRGQTRGRLPAGSGREMFLTILVVISAEHSDYVHTIPLYRSLTLDSNAFRLQRPSSDMLPTGLKWRSGRRISPCASRRTPSAWLFPCWHSEQICTPHPLIIGNRFIVSGYRCDQPEPYRCYVTLGPPEKRRSRIAVQRRFGIG